MENPRKMIFNELADTWDEHSNLTSERKETINNVLNHSSILQNDRILDVGCGTGILIPFLLYRLGPLGEVIAIDLAENMINIAREKFTDNRVSFVAGDILTKAFPHNSFDKIFVFSTFPHFDDKEGYLKVFYTILKRFGILTIFHVASSIEINNYHQKLESEVLKEDYLPSINEMVEFTRGSKWKVISAVDKTNLYQFQVMKDE
ncbi:MAG: class I SAM-dependent methyltransferase [Planctomycetes bacterium]|nr:class I SAM-dependent methyltransferase [Planctomycetota bacterium]